MRLFVSAACRIRPSRAPPPFCSGRLGLENSGIAAFDVNATCLGFVVALDLIAQAVATGRYRTVLIVASECVSIGLEDSDHTTAGLFGDGAGAAVIGAARRHGAQLRASHVQTFSSGLEFCQISLRRFRCGSAHAAR